MAARMLVDAGVDKNSRYPEGHTALSRTVLAGQVEVVRMLLEVGAEKNAADRKGNTALTHAVRNGHLETG